MSELQPGTTVTPTIRLVRALGAGGMGSVWVADHLALRTQVVVKFMSAELAASPDAVQRFSREAAAAAQVKSPHVVQMLDHGVTPDGVPFIAMELLEGNDLGKHLEKQGGRLSVEETAHIISQVAKALGRAHERGIVHRDIKPDNIFLCDVGSGELFVKLLDFGIAKAADGGGALSGSGTKTGATIGTPYYMSPEQMVGARNIDLRADLWSLGVVAYQCVVGGVPFNAETFGALAVMINSGPLPQPTIAFPGAPRAFDAWFARACAREPGARFASAKELADTLTAVGRGEPFGPAAMSGSGPRPAAGMPMAAPPMTTPAPGMLPAGRVSTNGGVGFATGPGPTAKSGAPWAIIGGGVVLVLVLAGVALGAVFAMRGRATASAPVASAATADPVSAASSLAPAAPAPLASAVATAATAATAATDAPSAGAVDASSVPATPATAKGGNPAAPPPHAPGAHTASPPVPTPTPAPVPTKNEKDIF